MTSCPQTEKIKTPEGEKERNTSPALLVPT